MNASSKDDISELSSSSHMDQERGSDHTATAGSFKRRKLVRLPTVASKSDDQTVQNYLNSFCTIHNEWSWKKQDEAGVFKQSLLTALLNKEGGEVLFDSQLFDVWKEWFNHEDDFVFFKIEKQADGTPVKAIALTRQLSKEKVDLVRGINIGVATDKSMNDHAVVLISWNQGVDDPNIEYCTSVVEIKMLDTSIRVSLKTSGVVDHPELKKSGPIVQSLSYISCLVWPSLVHMGYSPEQMRYTVIAGERPKMSKSDLKKARCIRGSYRAPPECGGAFQFTTDSFISAADDTNGTYTLYEYLCSVEEGFRLAWGYWARADRPPLKPLGGLAIPAALANCSTPGPKLIASPIHTRILKAGQGDIWELRTSLSNLRRINKVLMVRDVGTDINERAEVNCLLKVSSDGAFGAWVSPHDCSKALMLLKETHIPLGCLLGFMSLQTGIATVMEDLRAQQYECLSPRDAVDGGRVSLLQLWRGLYQLLNLTLLPAAKEGLVHADIRAGYNMTANILWRLRHGAVAMQLVDFDSFCEPLLIPDKDPRSLNPSGDAMSYLFLQVLSLGISWQDKIAQEDVQGGLLSEHSLIWFGIGLEPHPLPAEAPMVMWKCFDAQFSGSTFTMTAGEAAAMKAWRTGNTSATPEASTDTRIRSIYSSVGIWSQAGALLA